MGKIHKRQSKRDLVGEISTVKMRSKEVLAVRMNSREVLAAKGESREVLTTRMNPKEVLAVKGKYQGGSNGHREVQGTEISKY